MKILFDAHLSENKITGVGRYINKLLPALLEIDQENEYIILIADNLNSDHPLMNLKAPNLTKVPTNLRRLTLRQHWQTRNFVKKVKPDIYHHPQFDLPLGISVPSVVTIHDLKYLKYPEFFTEMSRLKRIYMKWAFGRALKRSKEIIAISQSTKNDLCQMFSVNWEKVNVVHHGIHPMDKSFNGSDESLLKKFTIKKPYILFVGERRPHKNIPCLIRAFDKVLKKSNQPIQLVIVGKAYKDYNELEQTIENLNLNRSVKIIGYISDENLGKLYSNAHIFVLPSLYEGFGFPILEAMQFDLPVIGANATSLPEVIGEAGLLVDPSNEEDIAEKILSILKYEGLREQLVIAARKRLKQFTWKNTALNTLKIYKKTYRESKNG